MLRRLSKKVSKVFSKKDAGDLPSSVGERDHEAYSRSPERPYGRRYSAPERRREYPTYDPYLATLPEERQSRRPWSDQSRIVKLPARRLNPISDEDLAVELYAAELEAFESDSAPDPDSFLSNSMPRKVSDRGMYRHDWEPYSEELWNLDAGPSAPSQQAVAGPSTVRRRPLNFSRPLSSTHATSTTGGNTQANSTWAPAWALDRVFGGPPSADVQIVPQNDTPTKDCIICVEDKSWESFPSSSPSAKCQHAPNACLDCIKQHIKTQLESKVFHERIIKCPECPESLDTSEVQVYADRNTFSLYEKRATDNAVSQIPNLFQCPTANCESAQIHESGDASPIVTCAKCNGRFCFTHRVAWHEDLTCAEYDAFLADPRGFRSRREIENERAERENREHRRLRRTQEEADSRVARGLLEEEQRGEERRRAEVRRREREERERAERERRREERRVMEERRRRMQIEAERKRREEQANLDTISRTTKNCPRCKWPIEKNHGCAHMTCIKCRYEFCWGCLNRYGSSHGYACTGSD